MDNASLCQLIREALHSPEKAEALALAIDHLPEIKAYLYKDWPPSYDQVFKEKIYDQAIKATMRDVKRNINRFPQMKRLNLETINCRNPDEAANIRKNFIGWVMMILKRDCIDEMRKLKNKIVISLNEPISEGWEIEDTIADRRNLNTIEVLITEEKLQENQKKEEELRCLIKSFVCHPNGYPYWFHQPKRLKCWYLHYMWIVLCTPLSGY